MVHGGARRFHIHPEQHLRLRTVFLPRSPAGLSDEDLGTVCLDDAIRPVPAIAREAWRLTWFLIRYSNVGLKMPCFERIFYLG